MIGAGALSERELGAALVNGDYTQFDPHTVKMMIRYMGLLLRLNNLGTLQKYMTADNSVPGCLMSTGQEL